MQLVSSQLVNCLHTKKRAVLARWDRKKACVFHLWLKAVNQFAEFDLEHRERATSHCCQRRYGDDDGNHHKDMKTWKATDRSSLQPEA